MTGLEPVTPTEAFEPEPTLKYGFYEYFGSPAPIGVGLYGLGFAKTHTKEDLKSGRSLTAVFLYLI